MSSKRVFVTGIVLFVAYMIMAILVHGLWLGPTYETLTGDVWRSQDDLLSKAWIVQGTTLIFCILFAYLFARGYRGGGWREGARFGCVAYFFAGFQAASHAYATYPIPLELMLQWFAAGLPITVLLGILASVLYDRQAKRLGDAGT
ncbi:MAG: hypothetical protein AAGC60_18165 [Acidobacteriota bacterium]